MHKNAFKAIKTLPKNVTFGGFWRLAYYNNNLYAASNVGLFEFKGHKIKYLYTWNKKDGMVNGPWMDYANKSLWVQRQDNGRLLRFDGKRWNGIGVPSPKSGFTRGDILRGIFCVSSKKKFWILAANSLWYWESKKNIWIHEKSFDKQFYRVAFMAPLNHELFFIIRDFFDDIAYDLGSNTGDSIFYFDKEWIEIKPNKSKFYTKDMVLVVYTNVVHTDLRFDLLFLRTSKGDLFCFDSFSKKISKILTPGFCEAIAKASNGNLVACFQIEGIFEYVKEFKVIESKDSLTKKQKLTLVSEYKWKLKYKYPLTKKLKHWTFLSENKGQIAVSMISKHANRGEKTSYLWISKDKELIEIEIK